MRDQRMDESPMPDRPPGESSRPDRRLAVVVPLANESRTVAPFLARLLAQLRSGDVVYCVLDLASRDDTRAQVEAFGARDSRVRVVWAPEDRGVGDAYRRGYREALGGDADWIVEMDGGLSHRPEELPRFLEALGNGAEFVAGSRFAPGGGYDGPRSRRSLSRGGTALVNALLGTRMSDMTSGYEAFTRDALAWLLRSAPVSGGHFIQTEVRVAMHRRHWVEVPISYMSPSAGLRVSEIGEALRELAVLWRRRRGGADVGLGLP